MRVSFDRLQYAHDNEGPEDLEYTPLTDDERGEEAENESDRRNKE